MKFTIKIFAYLFILFIILSVIGGFIIWRQQQKIIMEQAEIRAQSLFNMIIITRQWIADNRDRIKPVPAVATKELSLYADKMANFKFHITSNKLVNPANKPDEFEMRAIQHFLKGGKKYKEVSTTKDGKKIFKYMAPLYINKSCLKCHYYQNYKNGDFRGGISIQIPLNEMENAIFESNKTFIIHTFVIFTAIMISFAFLMYNLVLKNLKTFKHAATSVSLGNYNVKTNLKTKDEFEELSQVFDMMSEQILKNEETLKNELNKLGEMYNKLLTDVKEKNKQLESVTKFKSDILDSISHEVRTPLTKILSYSDILSNKQFLSDEKIRTKSIEIIKRNIKILKELFDNVLTLSRLDHQKEFYPTSVNISELITNILNDFQIDIFEKQLTVEKNLESFSTCIDVDYFQYVFRNLISNAVKYSYDKGKLKITCKTAKNGFEFSISNTGPGIKQEELDSIFKRFFRGSNVKDNISGVGLGLSIIKRIVDNHSGTISVKSEENNLTEFTIFIPSQKY